MDLELGFKVTRVADEFTSTEFQFAKDRAGPLFQTAETNTMFILTGHFKGYSRGNIKIDINEEGTIMVIAGEKPVQETVMVGWKVIKKDVEITKFTKAFRIPDGVILDKIRTKFNEEDSILTITMPKRVKGIVGIGIEEVKEPEPLIRADKIPKRVRFQEDKGAESSADHDLVSTCRKEEKLENEKEMPQKPLGETTLADQVSLETEMLFPGFPSNIQKAHEEVEKHGGEDGVPRMENKMPKVEETRETHRDQISDDTLESTCSGDQLKDDKVCEKASAIQQEEEKTGELTRKGEDEEKVPERRCKICVPVVAGSAVILSLVVFAIHFMRTKNRVEKRRG